MRGTLLSVLLAVVAGNASAQVSLVENCYSEMFAIEPVNFSTNVIEGREVTVRLTYKAPEGYARTLSAIELAFEIWSDARPLPLYSSHIRELRSIDGGLMSGEVIVGQDFHFMDDRVKELARQASDLTVRFEVQEVKDEAGIGLGCP
ncbi:hypothetical protein PhaeoP75_01093 [Phaeobacter gallaeciensis]|uniref:hypothetical protein n=1 Tax=Phaeobacter gallaeciensis TaxID=60890 RepID=UPI000BBBE89C|nr:hypothetical protein [Phaeobacter gallaeciensis]ATF00752.1 hypothetical protein PhaeoP75_01093 [Phaeobacter gallaeciensis]